MNPARVAGFLYLLLGLSVYRLIYIPRLFVHGDAAATSNNIAAHEWIFRLGMVSDLLAATIAIFLVLALYRLLKGVNQNHAVLMVILGGPMPAAVYFCNVMNDVAALMFARPADFLTLFEKPQRDAFVLLFLRLHDYGVFANEIFWGLWLIPFGILVYQSRFLPRILGAWLVLSSLPYLASSLTGFLWPQYQERVWNTLFPLASGEGAIMLWLLIKGPRPVERSNALQ
jgi:hypothetical protein